MSHIVSQAGPPFRDTLSARLRLAVIAFVLLNLALWSMAARSRAPNCSSSSF